MSSKIERLELFRHKSGVGRLGILIAEISQALEQGRLLDAFRLSDCACRIAPEDATCLLIHAKLLTRIGKGAEAALRLSGRTEPALMVARGLALCQQGLFDEAAPIGEWALSRFAVDTLDGAEQLAFTLCSNGGAAKPHLWVGIDSKLRLVGLISSGFRPTFSMPDKDLQAEFFPSSQDGFQSFRVTIPFGSSGFVSVHLNGLSQRTSSVFWPPEFGVSGWVVNEEESLRGKVGMEWAPALTFDVVIRQSGHERLRHTVVPSTGASSETEFSVPLECCVGDDSLFEVCAVLPDGRHLPLLGSPVQLRPWRPINFAVNAGTTPSVRSNAPVSTEKIDVVIPIYAGIRETMDCIESVLATTSATDVELVVVNDASPDSELHDALTPLAQTGRITLILNTENLGFPGSANKGMELHPQRDIVLLNSDTEVFRDWLNRLKHAAYAAEDIGTATPLGDCASIVSYTQSPSMTRSAAAEIDRIAATVNKGKLADLPVGVGFCLFIKRACLRETNLFDEASFTKGYGEENDFCLRASALGWRHVAATDVFVRHRGGLSFGRKKSALMERNGRILNMLHPGYDDLIARFVAADPLLDARRAIDMERLIAMASSPVLIVTGNLLGGVKRHAGARRAALEAEAHTVLMLQPSENDKAVSTVRLSVAGEALENLEFRIPEELDTLRGFLNRIGLEAFELHHFMGLPSPVLEMVRGLECPFTIYVHDYSWVCPRVFLVNGNGAYCGEPAIKECEKCIQTHGSLLDDPLSVQALRDRSALLFRDAKEIVAPTLDVRTRLSVYFPGVAVKVMAWETPVVPVPKVKSRVSGKVRVALIGAISIPKGYDVLLKCAQDAAARDLDLEFVLIGYSSSDEELLATGRVFVTGPYADEEVDALLAREQCQIAFFPSVVPETWCYALSHALAQGFAIVAFDLGAIAERLRGYSGAELLPLYTPASEINEALLRAARREARLVNQEEPVMDDASTSTQTPTAELLETSIQFLPLPAGTYVFTVNQGAPSTAQAGELLLPAVQVGVAPIASEATVEFVSRVTTTDRWLSRKRDMILARISGGSASLALTSLSARDLPVLDINIQRLNADMAAEGAEPGSASSSETPGLFPARIIAHIQKLGDVPFADGWAGCIGERLWIEAFAIGSAGSVTPDLIEYCGVTADGLQTPWLSNQVFCGSRGRATPIMGCAIRFKAPAAEQFDCIYTGQFVSGKVIGPFKNGDLCSSDQPLDPLWGIEVYAAERNPAASDIPSGDAQSAVMA
jgi:GT2 family glycosyltransferase/glycosyltransferase involved in cell wall biosynthesis